MLLAQSPPNPPPFVTAGPLHLLVLLGFAALCVAVCVTARRKAGTGNREPAFARALAWACLAGWVVQQGYFLGVVRDVRESLPLHICDLAALLGPLALLVRHTGARRVLRTLLFFWGFGLTTQGLVTPTLEHGPDHPRFYLFWLNHGSVVLLAIYDFVVRGYRPRLGDVWLAIAATYAMAALMIPVNLALDANYVFSGPSKPDAPTVLDALGPWPMRLVWMALVVALVFHVIWGLARLIPSGRARQTQTRISPAG